MRTVPSTGKSWSHVKPNSSMSLLYVTDPGAGAVDFYTYHNGTGLTLQGQLFGFGYPAQPCSDKAGNVFIPDYTLLTITEFAHGGTTPIQTLLGGISPTSCSIDKTTGNLAAADFAAGAVAIYTGATGLPTLYLWLTTPYPEYVTYDKSGNLFIEGQSALGGGVAFGEIPSGGSSITDLSTSGFTINFAGNIQWGGTYVLVGSQGNGTASEPSYVVQTSLSGSTLSGTNVLTFPGTSDITGYWKRGAPHYAHIVGANFAGADAQVDTFPGMSTINTITGLSSPFGAVVSP